MRKIDAVRYAVLVNEGYTAFCICDIMSDLYKEFMDMGCDLAWYRAIKMAEQFYDSKYDKSTKSEYECLQDYCKEEGSKWL